LGGGGVKIISRKICKGAIGAQKSGRVKNGKGGGW